MPVAQRATASVRIRQSPIGSATHRVTPAHGAWVPCSCIRACLYSSPRDASPQDVMASHPLLRGHRQPMWACSYACRSLEETRMIHSSIVAVMASACLVAAPAAGASSLSFVRTYSLQGDFVDEDGHVATDLSGLACTTLPARYCL